MNELKKARVLAEVPQTEVAECLGVSLHTYQAWEHGNRKPKVGYEHIIECVKAIGNLTEEGRKMLIDPSSSFDLDWALAQYKREEARRLSEWGAYNDTFELSFKRIPEGLFDKLTASEIALLVDAFKAAYDDGVAHGKGEEK